MNESLDTTQSGVPEGKEKLKIRILLADDDESVMKLSLKLLKQMGHTNVDTVGNGQQLLNKLNAGEYDLVFTDNNMPVMKGIEALKHIRADDRLKNLRVIVYSGDFELEEIVHGLGAVYLEKPFSKAEFYATVEKALAEPST